MSQIDPGQALVFAKPMSDLSPVFHLIALPLLAALLQRATRHWWRLALLALNGMNLILGGLFFVYPHNHQWIWFLDQSREIQWAFNAFLGLVWIAGGTLLMRRPAAGPK